MNRYSHFDEHKTGAAPGSPGSSSCFILIFFSIGTELFDRSVQLTILYTEGCSIIFNGSVVVLCNLTIDKVEECVVIHCNTGILFAYTSKGKPVCFIIIAVCVVR